MRHRDIKQFYQILFLRRLLAYLLVLRYVHLLKTIAENQSGNLIEEADEQGQVNIDYIYLGSVPIACVDEWWEGMKTPDAPTGLTITPGDKQLIVSWSANAEPVDWYRVHWGIELRKYTDSKDVGKVNSHTITDLVNGTTYYVSVTSYADIKETYYYHTDHLGTPILMTDKNQSVVWSGEFLPFGEEYSITGNVINNMGMLGQYYDVETEQYYNWHRTQNPNIGRFTTYDPSLRLRGSPEIPYLLPSFLKTPQKLNPYIFSLNNPIRFVDPFGLDINSVDFTVDFYIVGAGESIVWCCDKNKKKHRATYHKICYGLSIGANAASFGSPLTEEACPPKNGWKNEVCGALGGGLGTSWGGGDVSTGPVVGVGGGYMRCYYYLWNDKITGCCDN